MRPPVEHVRVSAKGKEILIKIKRRTGLEHWNEICRVALCRSFANQTPPTSLKFGESSIDMEWKTFAGQYHEVLSILTILRAKNDGIDILQRESIADYFRAHLERGIMSLQNVNKINDLI